VIFIERDENNLRSALTHALDIPPRFIERVRDCVSRAGEDHSDDHNDNTAG
jgi:hypothetical protein